MFLAEPLRQAFSFYPEAVPDSRSAEMSNWNILLAFAVILLLTENVSQANRYHRSLSKANKKFKCGTTIEVTTDLMTAGYNVTRGEWPWNGGLFHRNGLSKEYKCGATLIDENHALTAAHCVVNRDSGYQLNPRIVLVEFGNMELHGASNQHSVYEINVHPEFNSDGNKHDIAILSLKTTVVFNDYTVPICLPRSDADTSICDIVGKQGSVVGYGLTEDESSLSSPQLKQTKLPVVQHAECLESDPDLFARTIYPGMFCAGIRNNTSICNGDTGGGMYFLEGNSWTLRGIRYFSGARPAGTNKCDAEKYVGIINVKYYMTWISQAVNGELEIAPTNVTAGTGSQYTLPKPPHCGVTSPNSNVGGQQTKLDEFPWTGLIEHRYRDGSTGLGCGAALINSRYVVTPGYCVNSGFANSWEVIGVRLGEWDLDSPVDCAEADNCADAPINMAVEKIIVHEDFERDSRHNDIALIRFTRDVQFSSFVSPVCLPIENEQRLKNIVGARVIATRWNRRGTTGNRVKQTVDLEIQDMQSCALVHESRITKDTQICATSVQGQRGCIEDNGCPLTKLDRAHHYLYGILSFESGGCTSGGYPKLFINVAKYVDWIERNIQDSPSQPDTAIGK